ncbi:hypothetical protein [Caballeronia sp. TF1N1]|uniref:hypothetical protein n=1 Tax=Caballeronia sp. TF1N1 TaxID=2878153 RepID=UPI001FD4404A|nr:hypothetical protein [Caballeronia sp. TF1N1]
MKYFKTKLTQMTRVTGKRQLGEPAKLRFEKTSLIGISISSTTTCGAQADGALNTALPLVRTSFILRR